MKKIFAVLFGLSLLAAGCSDQGMPDEQGLGISEKSVYADIPETEAVSMADELLKKENQTRSNDEIPSVSYILKGAYRVHSSMRVSSTLLPDTIAYVVNYPNDGGFAIISASDCVYPVLAMSHEGNFSFDNEIASQNFLPNIEPYLAQNAGNESYEMSDGSLDECYVKMPRINIKIGQGSPWNKKVIVDHPGCPVGCVAVATALVTMYSADNLSYNGNKVWFISIIEAIRKHQDSSYKGAPCLIPNQPTYSYDKAVDLLAQYLYDIGKDINMSYAPKGSGAYSRDAYDWVRSQSYESPSGYAAYSISKIVERLDAGEMVYLRGYDALNGGHAWVCDGYRYCVNPWNENEIMDQYIHCDWGWDGSCNGYYSGNVFAAGSYNFMPQNFFSVKRKQSGLGPIVTPPKVEW